MKLCENSRAPHSRNPIARSDCQVAEMKKLTCLRQTYMRYVFFSSDTLDYVITLSTDSLSREAFKDISYKRVRLTILIIRA